MFNFRTAKGNARQVLRQALRQVLRQVQVSSQNNWEKETNNKINLAFLKLKLLNDRQPIKSRETPQAIVWRKVDAIVLQIQDGTNFFSAN